MKKMKFLFLSLFAAVSFFACSDDEGFGKLTYEGKDAYTMEIHRDTADSYKISLPIVSEKGLSKVVLVDALGNTLDEKTSFADPKAYIYEYKLDLTAYTQNSALMLTLNITDVDGQTIKQSITVNVKKFSELDIRFAATGTLVSFFEDCNLKVTVVRGMIALKEVQTYVGTDLVGTYDLSLDATQSKYDLNLLINGLKMGENTVKVVVVDAKDQEFAKEMIIKREPVKEIKDLNKIRLPQWAANINGVYQNESADITDYTHIRRIKVGMDMVTYESDYYLNFEYDGDKVTKMSYVSHFSDNEEVPLVVNQVFAYIYNENDELIKVTNQIGKGNAVDYVTDVVYELGNIKSYKLDGKLITANYIEKDGEMIRVDHLDAEMSGYTYGLNSRTYNNPTYVSGLPAVVPGKFGFFSMNFLYNRYLFDTINNGNTALETFANGALDSQGDWTYQVVTWGTNPDETFVQFEYKTRK